MSNDKIINPESCSCDEYNDSSEIIIQSLWHGRVYGVFIIFCNKCKEVEPVNVPHYINNTAELSQLMYKAWNQRNSSNQFNRAIKLLEACSEDLFITDTDKELENHIDTFLSEVKS